MKAELTPKMIDAFRELARLPVGCAKPKRVAMHWTAGTSAPNSVDLKAYHFLVNRDDTAYIVKGVYPVERNMRQLAPGDEDYAHHCGGYNSFSVGVSFCGERDARVRLQEYQVTRGLAFIAVAMRYEWGSLIPLNDKHLFSHFEAFTLHGVEGQHNRTKQDIRRLAWRPELNEKQVGDYLRATCFDYYRSLPRI
jgi:hypothetical protein